MNTEGVINHIVNWMKSYATQSGTKGFVVGVSGGIDSAVTSSLCALTGMPTLCVEMPIHQAESQVTRAQEHIAQLRKRFPNVSEQRLDLTDIFDTFVSALPEPDSDMHDHSLVNTRARFRMTTLYYFAGLRGALVAGTGNKVEDFGVGFYTKYGDGGVDLSPIADLVKTEVFALAKELGVPESIQIAPPTDGLWGDDRTDEDQIGASYPELEWAMSETDKGASASDFEGRKREVFEIYTRLHRANKHKMEPIPVCEIPDSLR
ncbi:MAG: NAD(+) synthase [Flavobacteriia bacterium]|nr:NAD(+) synthase [Flavobacteriia bacterium]